MGQRVFTQTLQPTSKGNPRIDFKIQIDRDSAQPEQSQKAAG
jgi:hypothetical protein